MVLLFWILGQAALIAVAVAVVSPLAAACLVPVYLLWALSRGPSPSGVPR